MAPATKKEKKNRGRGSKSKKQPGSTDEPSGEDAASCPPSSPSPPSQHQPPPSPPAAAPDHDATSSPPPLGVSGGIGCLSEAEKDIFWRVLLFSNGDDTCDSAEHLKGAAVTLEEIDGRTLLGDYLNLLSYSLPRTMLYMNTLKDSLEKKNKATFTRGLCKDLFAAALGDLAENFDSYEKMTKLMLKKAKHDRDRTHCREEWGGSSSSGAGGASGEPLNS